MPSLKYRLQILTEMAYLTLELRDGQESSGTKFRADHNALHDQLAISFRADIHSTMYGDLGLRLIRDSKRTLSLPALPPPQLTLIRQILQEIKSLDLSASAILQSLPSLSSIQQDFPSEACAILIHHLCMRRNRRCLLAYQRLRADRIDEMVWGGGEVKGVLSPEEEEYGRGYALLVAGLKGRWTDVELGGSLEPPRDLYVEVRVLKDAGEIQTEYG